MTQTTQTRDKIIKMLKDWGCRMTKQRRILLDIILEDNCSSCKEIYYRASKKDKSIGTATVYRMLNALEEIGAVTRKNIIVVNLDDKEEEAQPSYPKNFKQCRQCIRKARSNPGFSC